MSNSYSKRTEIYNFYNRYINQVYSLINDLPTNTNFNKTKIHSDVSNLRELLQQKNDNKSINDFEFVIFLQKDFKDRLNNIYQNLYDLLNKICNKFKDNTQLKELQRRYNDLIRTSNLKTRNLEIKVQQLTTQIKDPRRNIRRNYHYPYGGVQNNKLSLQN